MEKIKRSVADTSQICYNKLESMEKTRKGNHHILSKKME
jgi:hypothetical protein